jgi:hypothetical protein
MQQINENLVVIFAGDPWEEAMNDYLKIYLGGSVDLGEKFNWHGKFIQGLTKLTDPIAGDPRYNDKKFLIMSPRVPVINPSPTLDNPEFINKKRWEFDMLKKSDVVFCNFLKKATTPGAINELLLMATSGKLVVRCPLDYFNYPTIKTISDSFGFPIFGETANTLDILQYMFTSIPKFVNIQNYGL